MSVMSSVDLGGPAGLKKYRIIEWCSDGENFSQMRTANSAGLLGVSQEICRMRMAEKALPDVPPYCAVVP